MKRLQKQKPSAWAPREALRPKTEARGDDLLVAANGKPACFGGWQIVFEDLEGENWLELTARARWQDVENPHDNVRAGVVFLAADGATVAWEPLLPGDREKEGLNFGCRAWAPKSAVRAVLTLLLAWSGRGIVWWSGVGAGYTSAPQRRPLRLGAAGAPLPHRPSLQANTAYYLDLARRAADRGVELLCLPEVMLTWGIELPSERFPELAVEIPGPEVEPFQRLARERSMAICFSAWEKADEMVHNTGLLIDRDGEITGKYRKVHLAVPGEYLRGVTPGDGFPVFEAAGARVGMNICMDSSALESARGAARNGAEIICLPIMGDHRASYCMDGREEYEFDVDRWQMIQCMRAMDNHVYMVVSRNHGVGTGVFGPTGTTLAMSAGGSPIAWADVDLADRPRSRHGSSYYGDLWFERRASAYGTLAESSLGLR
jgi:N-carbamoylputrescine amidase